MQQKNHRSVSLLLFWKCFLLICLPLWTLPTFFKNKKLLENKKTFKNVKTRDQNKKNVKRFLHLWLKHTVATDWQHTTSCTKLQTNLIIDTAGKLYAARSMKWSSVRPSVQSINGVRRGTGLFNYCSVLFLINLHLSSNSNTSTTWFFWLYFNIFVLYNWSFASDIMYVLFTEYILFSY